MASTGRMCTRAPSRISTRSAGWDRVWPTSPATGVGLVPSDPFARAAERLQQAVAIEGLEQVVDRVHLERLQRVSSNAVTNTTG